MSKISLSRIKGRLREGISLNWDGRPITLQPKWGLIAEEVLPLSVPNSEDREIVWGEFSARKVNGLMMSSDPRILLLGLRYLLWVSQIRQDDFRQIESDPEKAREEFDELYDKFGAIIAEGYAGSITA